MKDKEQKLKEIVAGFYKSKLFSFCILLLLMAGLYLMFNTNSYINNYMWRGACINSDNINYSGVNPSVADLTFYDCGKIGDRFCWSKGLNIDECLERYG